MTPRVSAIIIFLNEERYLDEAIESVFAQTFTDWELLLIDDGSTDRSGEIAQSWEARHPEQVRYLQHPDGANRGMSASRNLGIGAAKGEFISFLDGDDTWLPDKLAIQVAHLDAMPEAAMTYGPLIEWHSWIDPDPDESKDLLYGVDRSGVHPYANTLVTNPDLLVLFLRNETYIPSSIMVRVAVVQALGGFEDEFRDSYEDAVFHVKLCANYPVYVHQEALYRYRIHPESNERQVEKEGLKREKLARFLNWVKSYIASEPNVDLEVHRALEHAFWPLRHPRLNAVVQFFRTLRWRITLAALVMGRKALPQGLRDMLWQRFAARGKS